MADREFPPPPAPLPVPVLDNHTHLDHVFEVEGLDWVTQLERASDAGVAGVVTVGTDLVSSRASVAFADADQRVLAAVALHPNDAPVVALSAPGALDDAMAELAELARHPRTRAIGETGLDYFRTDGEAELAAQLDSFERHIELAKQAGVAVQIHDRDAHADVVATLLRVGAPERTVFHCFSGDAELAAIAAEHGWYCSFAGTVTFKNAPNLRAALDVLPRELVLVETDAPYLTPHPMRGRPNASYLMPHTVRAMAEHLDVDVDRLCEQLTANTVAVYGQW